MASPIFPRNKDSQKHKFDDLIESNFLRSSRSILLSLCLFSAVLSGCLEDIEIESLGCTDPDALNYNESAIVDDNTCEYAEENPKVIIDLDLNSSVVHSPLNWEDSIFTGSNLFFRVSNFAGDGKYSWSGGLELGVINVSTEEMTLIDINAGGVSSPYYMTPAGDGIVFQADDGIHGIELWYSDGTEDGTNMVLDLMEGPDSSHPSHIYARNDVVYFTAINEDEGRELFVTETTSGGTTLLSEFSDSWSGISDGVFFEGDFYFVHMEELWVTDGTRSGTQPISELTGEVSSFELGGELFFISNGLSFSSLWVLDASLGSLSLVEELDFDSREELEFVEMGTYVYFVTYDDMLFRTNGLEGGSSVIFDFNAHPSNPHNVSRLRSDGCNLFMYGGVGSHSLWTSDGTESGTYIWLDYYFFHGDYELFGNTMISAGTIDSYPALYETDILANTTELLQEDVIPSNADVTSFTSNGEEILLKYGIDKIAKYTIENKTEASRCSYDLAEYDLLESLDRPYGATGVPNHITAFNEGVIYAFSGLSRGVELWFSDGTTVGTYNVKNINPGGAHSHPMHFASNGTHTFFTADDGTHGRELWVTDGTGPGTYLVKDINPGSNLAFSGDPEFQFIGDLTYFKTLGGELYVTDGSSAGTYSLTGSGPSNVANLHNHDSMIYFSARTSTSGHELWHSDGTEAGTIQISDICSGTCSSTPSNFVSHNDGVAFVANDGIHGGEIWFSDGTESGTALFADVLAGSDSSTPTNLYSMNSKLFFVANNSAYGSELWVANDFSDFQVVLDINPGSDGSDVDNMISFDQILYFTADDGENGHELWSYNLLTESANLVIDVSTSGSSDPHDLILANNILYFLADDGVHGVEIWSYNLTSGDGYLFTDLYVTTSSIVFLNDLTLVDEIIFFVGSNGGGRTIWTLDTRLPYDESMKVILTFPIP